MKRSTASFASFFALVAFAGATAAFTSVTRGPALAAPSASQAVPTPLPSPMPTNTGTPAPYPSLPPGGPSPSPHA